MKKLRLTPTVAAVAGSGDGDRDRREGTTIAGGVTGDKRGGANEKESLSNEDSGSAGFMPSPPTTDRLHLQGHAPDTSNGSHLEVSRKS